MNGNQIGNFQPRINSLYVNIDGACKGNPGEASIAVVIRGEDRKVLEEYCEAIGNSTNNIAEYMAALKALELAAKYCRDEIKIFSDSKLLVNHITGRYRIRDKKLFEILVQIKSLEKLFKRVLYFHVDRKYNMRADELANKVFQVKNPNIFSDKKWPTKNNP